MKKESVYESALGPAIRRYLELKFALGRRFAVESATLQSVDRFLTALPVAAQDLTAATFQSWCQTQLAVTNGVRRNRMRIVRNFCLYRRRTEPDCFVPNPILFPTRHQPAAPYIYSPSQVAQLLDACPSLPRSPSSPLRPEVIRLAIVLLYTTGIRRGELLRLTISDFDSRQRTLFIGASKFHKSRILPLPEDVIGEVERYLRIRRQHHRVSPEMPLIWNRTHGGRAYTGQGLRSNLEILLERCRIHTPAGRFPRVHDFRHSFAANALIRWYRSNVDVQAKLPFLAAYLGHVSVLSTYHYLHFIEPLRTVANKRFAASYGSLIDPTPGGKQ